MDHHSQLQQQIQEQERYHRVMNDFNDFTVVQEECNDNYDASTLTSIERQLCPSRNTFHSRAHSATTTTTNDTSRSCNSIDYMTTNIEDQARMMILMRNSGTIQPSSSKRIRSASASDIRPLVVIQQQQQQYSNNNISNNNYDVEDDDDILNLLETMDDSAHLDCNADDDDYQKGVSDLTSQQEQRHRRQSSYSNDTKSHNGVPIIPSQNVMSTTRSNQQQQIQQHCRGQYPFFDYIDYSREVDMTPDVPLTAAGRVPTFLAKLHAILLCPELQSIVRWLPHGRSWKVYDTTAFEKQVINIYFEFTKHANSSFYRQAKLWGFLRIKQNKANEDYDSYYHPRFLRGLPYLCKDVRRPPATQLPEQPAIDYEPNLTAISNIYPIPPSSYAIRTDPTIQLDWFMKGKQHNTTNKSSSSSYPLPPTKESITKKSSSTSTATSFTSTTTAGTSSIVKRKRSTAAASTITSTIQPQPQPQLLQSSISSSSNSSSAPTMSVSDHLQYNSYRPVSNSNMHEQKSTVSADIRLPNTYTMHTNIDIDVDDSDDEPIDDDLGLNLSPFFSNGYQLYPFYDYLDHSMKVDLYPFQPYTDVGQRPQFPMILHAIFLLLQHQKGYDVPIIEWQAHGRAFKICSPSKLETQILPNFLHDNHTIGSFLRQLTLWGFKRIEKQNHQHQQQQNSNNDINCYYHPKFLRGLPHLCKDWYINYDQPSASSLLSSSSSASSASKVRTIMNDMEDNDNSNNNDNNNSNSNEYPVPDFTKISQLYPIPEYYDPNLTIEDLMGW